MYATTPYLEAEMAYRRQRIGQQWRPVRRRRRGMLTRHREV